MARDTERRTVPGDLTISGDGRLTGLAVRWDLPAIDWQTFRERMAPSSCTKTAKERRPGVIAGSLSLGPAELEPTPDGLGFAVGLPDTDAGRNLAELIRRGDVTHVAADFRVIRERWHDGLRIVTELALEGIEVAFTTGADDVTTALRSMPPPEYDPGELDDLAARAAALT